VSTPQARQEAALPEGVSIFEATQLKGQPPRERKPGEDARLENGWYTTRTWEADKSGRV